MTSIIMDSNSINDGWFVPNQVIDLCVSIKNQVVELKGYVESAFKTIRKVQQKVIEQKINIIGITIAPYELDGHKTIKPFDVSMECLATGDFSARFDEAGIAIISDTMSNAISELKEVIITLYGIYKESELGPEPMRQLSVLEKYIE